MTGDNGTLTIRVTASGRAGAELELRQGDRVLAVDAVRRLASQKDRDELVSRWCEQYPGLPLDDLKQQLTEQAARVAEARKKTGAEAPVGDAQQGRALELADPEPWPEPVDGAALLDEIASTLRRHVSLPPAADVACALWLVHSYTFRLWRHTPRLGITSATKRCGKSTLLGLLAKLASRSLQASSLTAASVFRVIEKARPTLLIDEADSFLRDNEELRGVLNSGHGADGFVVRCVGDDHEPRQFATFAPVAIALIGKLPPTLEDRAILVELRRRHRGEPIERVPTDGAAFTKLHRQLRRWADDHEEQLRTAEPEMPGALNDRARDGWLPLLAIAAIAGGTWSERARSAAEVLSSREEDEIVVLLLGDILDIFEVKGRDRIGSDELVKVLGAMTERPWSEWRRGQPVTQRQLARLLAPLGIAPKTLRLPSGEQAKGYERSAFDDAVARYLPERSVPTSQPSDLAGSRSIPIRPTSGAGTDRNGPPAQQPGGLGRMDGSRRGSPDALVTSGRNGPPAVPTCTAEQFISDASFLTDAQAAELREIVAGARVSARRRGADPERFAADVVRGHLDALRPASEVLPW